MAHEPKKAAALSQPLTAAPMPEYAYQPYIPSRERVEDEKEKKETAERKLDLSGVVLNLS